MTEYALPYDKSSLKVIIPDEFKVDLLEPNTLEPLSNPQDEINQALANPLGKKNLEAFSDIESIGIAINDKTRPVPHPNPTLNLLKHLEGLGFTPENITLFVGSGTHAQMKETELTRLLQQEIIDRYKIVVHNCDQSPLVDLGQTKYQTPIQINADFFHCDLKITIGNIEPHHFMGFSGGVKTAVIGLAGRETINTNHTMLSHPRAKSGVYHINPMRQDIEEIGQKADIRFTLGTVLDENKNIIKVFFGDPLDVMNAAIPVIRQIFGLSVPKAYDLVIASPGGAPKDINLYQAQKALTHAARITRDGGWVILLAACPEGSGSKSYENYITSAKSHQAIIDQFRDGFFEIGPHKAFQIAKEAVRVNVVLVSDLPPEDVKRWKLTPSTPKLLNPLIGYVINNLSQDGRIAILPEATRTMAEVKNNG